MEKKPEIALKIVAAGTPGCQKPGCARNVVARGLCSSCYKIMPIMKRCDRGPLGCVVTGCDKVGRFKGLCEEHFTVRYGISPKARAAAPLFAMPDPLAKPKRKRSPNGRPKPFLSNGYRFVFVEPGHPNAKPWQGRKYWVIAEHRKVMQEKLRRRLVDGENVHHINGVRDDNRPENLELWVVSQPAGQRVAEKLAWAREFVARYGTQAETEITLTQLRTSHVE